ncbi:glycosyltransferase family 2 protein [Clostridium perfringens]|uniref:glycosyltransferase family 2 protein n=1 Tax=Clostridium perfringens TaxID=1502 RepID=UPI0018E4216B|nr:glycosyltransferase family 2 protein [Clostridium perfringens]MBI6045815.1 glycosyltransferase family 2 protein [Clostridium perfringens]MDH5070827.1 Glycosyl transferase family 2 [Clostridium perfringens]MDH5090607.1 Glycosyl transferase family 2 [Clostridium perfringens]MDK0968738.1 glycosyltransferase family 2 protein [Clostridium perfringens]MDU1913846.1 glycosyltransferase family 2 protein [Clostridium perfringens]
MLSLTAIILTKNESFNIEKCIKSFSGIMERIIIVDSFSDDNTKELAENLGAEVYEHEFLNHSDQFNWALDNLNIKSDWIFRVDADEELTTELVNELKDKLNKINNNINGIFIKRRRYFLGKWIKHGDVYPERVLRIFRNGKGRSEDRIMDEHIVLNDGATICFENDIEDKDTKDLTFWINKHNWYSNLEAEEYLKIKEKINDKSNKNINENLFGKQRERKRWLKNKLYYNIPLFARPFLYFLYRYILKLGFLDGKEGLIYHFLQGFWYRFLVDSKIYEINKENILQGVNNSYE